MSLDSYAFAVPKGTDLDTVKERFQNDEVEILHHWDNNDYLHSSMERRWKIYNRTSTEEFTEQFFKLDEYDLFALKKWYETNQYDEIDNNKSDMDFFEFGQFLIQCGNVDIYYVSSI